MSEQKHVILAFSSNGNPSSEKVWSNFPSNIIEALKSESPNLVVMTLSSRLSTFTHFFIKLIESINGNKLGTSRLRRFAISFKCQAKIMLIKPDSVIYFGTDCVPWFFRQKKIIQILVIFENYR